VICGEVVGILRESVNHKTQISRGDEVEKQSEKGYGSVEEVRATGFQLVCEAATANVCSSDVYHHGARDLASDCSFRT